MSLETHDVVVRFDGLTALDGLSIAIDEGEIVGLIGPNGSGKTTLLNAISGVLQPTSGDFSMGGKRWASISPTEAARIGIRRTFQNIRLFNDMTALETVEVAAAALGRGNRRALAWEALRQVNLLQYQWRIATELPYGVQRRLEIARAMAGRLNFLLLDEPTAGLNKTESDELVQIIRMIRDRYGCGILLVDHDLRVIMTACSRIIVLNEGKVISQGKPEQVRRDPVVIRAYLG
jgi:ABC-type branched-subunit amino acid transport system ATPase component